MKELQERIDKIFEESDHQGEAIIALYKIFIPEWEAVEKIKGWPSAGYKLSRLIWGKFMEFDRKHHPEVMAGGLWMNNGFSENRELDDWQVDLSTCTIEKGGYDKTMIIPAKGGAECHD